MDWDDVYAAGHNELAPFDEVVSFVYRNLEGRDTGQVHICEVGYGAGPNLKFLHDQGFRVYGVERSPSARSKALEKVPLPERLLTGGFNNLDFSDGCFDMVIDRAALWYASDEKELGAALAEISRVLRPGGKFLYTPLHSIEDERFPVTLTRSEEDIYDRLAEHDLVIESLDLVTIYDVMKGADKVAYFRVAARKE